MSDFVLNYVSVYVHELVDIYTPRLRWVKEYYFFLFNIIVVMILKIKRIKHIPDKITNPQSLHVALSQFVFTIK